MVTSDNSQGTTEWRRERLGRVTASKFDAVMAGPKSAAYLSYARQLRDEIKILARLNAGEEVLPQPEFYSAPLAWGRRHERAARARYELEMDCDVEVPTFRTHPELPFVGCSPDGCHPMLGEGQKAKHRKRRERSRSVVGMIGLEMKCPWKQDIHARTLVSGMPPEHKPQVQGQMWVCGYVAVDFVSFDPRRTDGRELVVYRQYSDDAYLIVLADAVLKFWDFVLSGKDAPGSRVIESIPQLF